VTRASATIRDHDLQELRQYFSEEQIVELALTVCAANFTNRVNDSLINDPDLG
jgi:alkylhydroperoxidase family enzyme